MICAIILGMATFVAIIISLILCCLKKNKDKNNFTENNAISSFFMTFLPLFCFFTLAILTGIWVYLMVSQIFLDTSIHKFPSSILFPFQYISIMIILFLDSIFLLTYIILAMIRMNLSSLEIMDWEEPNIIRIVNNSIKKSLSMWREINFTSEIYKLMTYDPINCSLISLITLAIFHGFDLNRYSHLSTDASFSNSSVYFEVAIFRFFWIFIIHNLLLLIFMFLNKINAIFNGSLSDNLIDFCTISNISLLFNKNNQRVIYIHGKSCFDSGEGTLAFIYKKLKLESNESFFRRGLDSSFDKQVFDVLQVAPENHLSEKMIDQIRTHILSGKLSVVLKSFTQKFFGWKSNSQNESLKLNPQDNSLVFQIEDNSYIQNYLYESVSPFVLLFTSILIGIFDFACGSLITGLIIANCFQQILKFTHSYLLLSNLKRLNPIDERLIK